MPMEKIGFRRLLTALGILIIGLLALAFILGIVSLKRTQEIVSDDFQQQQLILAKATARQIEDGLAFLRRELRILAFSPAIQYLEDVAWANRMKVSFNELSKMGVVTIERIDFAGKAADKAYVLDAGGPRLRPEDFSQAPEVAWARDPANRGRIYQGPIILQPNGGHKTPFMIMATPVYEESVDESHPRATGNLDGVLLFKIDLAQFTGHYCANIRSGRTGYCWVMDDKGIFLYHPEREFIGEDARLTGIGLLNNQTGSEETLPVDGAFIFVGLTPNTGFLEGSGVLLDQWGFVVTGHDLLHRGERPKDYADRDPHILETSVPGIFAAGDVRDKSTKQVASAAGEGASATLIIREYLKTI